MDSMSEKSESLVFSPTKVGLWKDCPFAYYLRYNLKKKPKIPIYNALGRTIHYMLKLFYEKNFKSEESFVNCWKHYFRMYMAGDFLSKNKDEIEKRVVEVKFANGDEGEIVVASDFLIFDLNDEEVKRTFWGALHAGQSMLTQFYRKHISDDKPLTTEKQLRTNFRGYNLLGVIDKIVEEDGKKIIVDYKTTRREPSNMELNKGWQFTFYSLLFRLNYDEDEDSLVIEHLRTGKEFKTTRNEGDFDNLEEVLDEMSDSIIREKFNPNFNYRCRSCLYRTICEEIHHINIDEKIK